MDQPIENKTNVNNSSVLNSAELDKRVADIISEVRDANSLTGRNMLNKFLLGILSGLGATLGIALLFTILGFIIKQLGGIPVLGNWLSELGRYIHK